MAARRGRGNPLTEFSQPGRRRTDHPLVVGTIVLCLGITAVGTIFQVVAQLALGQHIATAIKKTDARDAETRVMRGAFQENMRAQASLLRRVCLNVARTPTEQRDCEQTEGRPPN